MIDDVEQLADARWIPSVPDRCAEGDDIQHRAVQDLAGRQQTIQFLEVAGWQVAF